MAEKPLTRAEIIELASRIHAGWYPGPELVAKAQSGLSAVLADPLRNPRATVRAARLIFEIQAALIEAETIGE